MPERFPQHARDLFLGKCVLLFWVVDYFPIFFLSCALCAYDTSEYFNIKQPKENKASSFLCSLQIYYLVHVFFFCFCFLLKWCLIHFLQSLSPFFFSVCTFSVNFIYLVEQQYFMYILYHFLWCFIICVRWWCDDNRKNIKYSIARQWIFFIVTILQFVYAAMFDFMLALFMAAQ